MPRTTHRSKTGRKLYAKRAKAGEFDDIQVYERAHGSDVKRSSAAERAKKKASKKKSSKKTSSKKSAKTSAAKKKVGKKKAGRKKASRK